MSTPSVPSIPSVLLRFGVSYIGFLVSFIRIFKPAGLVMLLLQVIVLMMASMVASQKFAIGNGRFFTAKEKRTAVLGMVLIDLVFQVGFELMSLHQTGKIGGQSFHIGSTVIFTAIAVLINAAIIWFSVGLAGKLFARRLAKSGAPVQS